MVTANVREQSSHIKRKLTRAGLPNPRIRNAKRQEAEAKQERKDITFIAWKKADIAKTYTEEYVTNLLQRANANLKNMTATKVRPFWLPEE